ncbi:MAG: hypothetical protein ABFD54_10010 [Armatimonadota bacterium]|nr:hypothetical protein [bacterium]
MPDTAEQYKLEVEAFKAGNTDTAIEEVTRLDHQNHRTFSYLGAAYQHSHWGIQAG